MAQDSERVRPESNGHYEHIIPELPQQDDTDEIEQEQQEQQEQPIQQPDPHYSYGATPAPQSQEILEPHQPVQSSQPSPPSYDSPEFYTQPQSAQAQQAQQMQQAIPEPPVDKEQPPYGYTPQYGTPPTASPYGTSSGYGHGAPPYGGYNGQYNQYNRYSYGGYGYQRFDFDGEPHSSPLPLGAAIRGLLAQYGQAIAHPSPRLFAREMGKAKWNTVWVQIIGYSIIVALFSLLSAIGFDVNAAAKSVVAGADTSGLTPAAVGVLEHIIVIVYNLSIYGQILITPIALFIGTGILFLLAKIFGGTGKFLPQLYCSLLFLIPLGIIGSFLSLLLSYLPAGGSAFGFLITVAKLVYECILLGYMLVPVHRISGGRATGAILLLFGVIFLLACILAFVFAAIFAAIVGTA